MGCRAVAARSHGRHCGAGRPGRATPPPTLSASAGCEIVGTQKPKHAQELEIYPDIWAGFGLVRNGPGTAIVGDPETVAARILEYRDVGFDTFIVSGQPLLEETYRVADLLLPLLPFDRGDRRQTATSDRSFLQCCTRLTMLRSTFLRVAVAAFLIGLALHVSERGRISGDAGDSPARLPART